MLKKMFLMSGDLTGLCLCMLTLESCEYTIIETSRNSTQVGFEPTTAMIFFKLQTALPTLPPGSDKKLLSYEFFLSFFLLRGVIDNFGLFQPPKLDWSLCYDGST